MPPRVGSYARWLGIEARNARLLAARSKLHRDAETISEPLDGMICVDPRVDVQLEGQRVRALAPRNLDSNSAIPHGSSRDVQETVTVLPSQALPERTRHEVSVRFGDLRRHSPPA